MSLKLWERAKEIRTRRFTSISKSQFGFIPRRSTIEEIHLMRQMTEYHRARKKETCTWFLLNWKKTYEKVPKKYFGRQ